MMASTIDTAIERYAQERRTLSKKEAQAHFLSYTYVVCGANHAEDFLKRTRGMLCYYIDCLSIFDNPFRAPQACWLVLMAMVFAFGLFMLGNDDTIVAGLFIAGGTLVNGMSIWRIVCTRWLDTGIMIAHYREIIELIDRTLPVRG